MESKFNDPFLRRMIRGYCLEELLGHGSLTAVYRAHTEELWQVPELLITIFLISDKLSEQAKVVFKARFMREGRKLARLRHAHLFPLYGYGEEDGLFYLLAPPVHGEILTRQWWWGQPRSSEDALSILLPIADAFDYLHSQGQVYKYFNPTNVLFLSDRTITLSGLGLTQLLSMQGLEQEIAEVASGQHLKSIAGTFLSAPEYLAPEVVEGMEADNRSDIYALGILLFALLSGKPPFSGKSYMEIAQKHVEEPLPVLHEIIPDLPNALEQAVNRALHRNPDQRFQTIKEFITACTYAIKAHGPVTRIRTGESGEEHTTTHINVPIPPLISHAQEATKSQETGTLFKKDDTQQTRQTESVNIATMVNQLQQIKERLQAQSIAHTTNILPEGNKVDG